MFGTQTSDASEALHNYATDAGMGTLSKDHAADILANLKKPPINPPKPEPLGDPLPDAPINASKLKGFTKGQKVAMTVGTVGAVAGGGAVLLAVLGHHKNSQGQDVVG